VTALYIRLSEEDRDLSSRPDKAESNSITNQRSLLWEYIRSHEEFSGCTVIEKCDDGYSGVKFDNRPAFTELMELAKAGKINCIMVKDFSRFGRDYVELGDYLEQYFPFLSIRFISVNDGYDSKNFEGTTGGLDVAFKNMIYDFYSREFSKKQKIAWRRMTEKGEYNAVRVLYGYQKAADNIRQIVISEEAGSVVREIFGMAASGMSPIRIARLLNEKGIPSPSETQHMQGCPREWAGYGTKCFWTDDRIRRMIKDERYTGTMVSLKTTSYAVRGKRVKTPPSEWVRVENTHEPLVSYELYLKANSVIRQLRFRQSGKKERNIYHCGYCGRKMQDTGRGIIRCGQRYLIKECSCREASIKRGEADRAVMDALKQQIQLFVKESELSQNARSRTVPYSVDEEIISLTKTIVALKKTWMPLYEQYRDGQLSREDFLTRKREYDAEVAKLEQRLDELQGSINEQDERSRQKRKHASQLMCFAEQMELTEEIKEKLIDKVKVYSNNRIEIYWKFESGFSDTGTT